LWGGGILTTDEDLYVAMWKYDKSGKQMVRSVNKDKGIGFSIALDGSDIYIAGASPNENDEAIGTIWKYNNNLEGRVFAKSNIGEISESVAFSMALYGGNIYTTGINDHFTTDNELSSEMFIASFHK